MNKQEIKEALSKKPTELSKTELEILFGIFSLHIKEYYIGENNMSFEIHFERTFIIRVHYPIVNGFMNFNNEFVNFGDGCHGISMSNSKDTGELLKVFINMFYDTLLNQAHYAVCFDEESSSYSSIEEMQEYVEYVQSLI